MSSFTGNILLEQIGNTVNCEVKRAFTFYSDIHALEVTVKRGFITDLDSIPPILKGIVRGSSPRYWRAYVIHDALYRMGFDRKKADQILDEALEVLGMDWYTRSKIYYPLRLFGSSTTCELLIENAVENVIIDLL